VLVIVATVPSPVSLIVPPFNAVAFVPITNISPAFVAELAAPIVHLNNNSLVVDPDK